MLCLGPVSAGGTKGHLSLLFLQCHSPGSMSNGSGRTAEERGFSSLRPMKSPLVHVSMRCNPMAARLCPADR